MYIDTTPPRRDGSDTRYVGNDLTFYKDSKGKEGKEAEDVARERGAAAAARPI